MRAAQVKAVKHDEQDACPNQHMQPGNDWGRSKTSSCLFTRFPGLAHSASKNKLNNHEGYG
jgi:hypothetical protein